MDAVTRETRIESYITTPRQKRKRQIIDALTEPMTARQIARKLGYADLNAVKPRLTELVNDGILEVAGKAYDMTTSRNVAMYQRKVVAK